MIKPLKQGDLDFTCGFYAVINAIRLASAQISPFTSAQSQELYLALIEEAAKRHKLEDMLLYGTDSRDLSVFLQKAKIWIGEEKGIALNWKRPFAQGPLPPRTVLFSQLRGRLGAGASLIAGFSLREDEHWSVIQRLSLTSVGLMDSCGRRRLSLSKVTLKGLSDKRPFLICARGLTILSCQKSRRPQNA